MWRIDSPPVSVPFQIVRPLGRGAMAEVYEVRLSDGRRAAAKVLTRLEPRALDRFQREFELVRRLDHPAIVGVIESGVTPEQRPYMLLELVEGQTLDERSKGGAAPFAVGEVAALGASLAEGLAHAHGQGVVHRDLKPSNVLLRADGSPCLTDFGIARALDLERLTVSGALVGTPLYMAPEQIANEDVGPPADVYGLGAVLYELLAGQSAIPPHDSLPGLLASILQARIEPLRSLCPEVPLVLAGWIERALDRDPVVRPTAAELAATLRECAAGSPAPPRRRSPRLGLALALVGLLGAGALAAGWRARPAAEPSPTRSPAPAASPATPREVDLSLRYERGARYRFTIGRSQRGGGPLGHSRLLAVVTVRARHEGRTLLGGTLTRVIFAPPGSALSEVVEDLPAEPPPEPPQPGSFDSTRERNGMFDPLRPLHLAPIQVWLDEGRGGGRFEGLSAVLDGTPLRGRPVVAGYRDESMSRSVNLMTQVLPGRPVAVGEEWELTLSDPPLRRRCRLVDPGDGSYRVEHESLAPWREGRRVSSFDGVVVWRDGALERASCWSRPVEGSADPTFPGVEELLWRFERER